MINILFVCSGNSCRSQMAEGFGKALSGGRFGIKSAGTSPVGIHPMTIKTMNEAGIEISDQKSDLLTSELIQWCDYLITLCGSACERIPPLPARVKHIHWDIENPNLLFNSEESRRREFARGRDKIKNEVNQLFSKIDRGEM
ncbi:MAG: arsenate reductase ArsC [candidate division Zixibacteria bacterium]|nr:arsenate reductase ArsC [candidate division Zixibacteria bacterium]